MINPIYFYLIDLADAADTVLCIFALVFVSAALILFGLIAADQFYDDETEKAKRYCKRFAVIGAACPVFAIAIPSKQTMVEVLVAKYATEDNAKAVIDYIVETWGQLK